MVNFSIGLCLFAGSTDLVLRDRLVGVVSAEKWFNVKGITTTYCLYPLCCLIVSINKPLPDIWLKVGANVKLCGMSRVNGCRQQSNLSPSLLTADSLWA